MVFHPELYAHYLDPWMNVYPWISVNSIHVSTAIRTTPVDETTLPQLDSFTGNEDSTNIYALTSVLPRLAQAVAEHYNCPGAQYFPLEVSGSASSASMH